MYPWHQPLPKTYGSEHFLPIANIPSWGEFSHQDKDRTKKCTTKIMPSISKCQHFPSPRASTKTYRNQNPGSKSILFPKNFRLTSVALFVFIQKNSPSNSKALRIFQKDTKKPPKPRFAFISRGTVSGLAVLSLGDKRLSRFGPP